MHIYKDGGRWASGRKGKAGDCVVRAIALATGEDYDAIYKSLAAKQKDLSGVATARSGINKTVYEPFLKSLGWEWQKVIHPAGRKARPADLPKGRFIAAMAKHLTCVVDGDVWDTWDCSEKMVYGYYRYTGNITPLESDRDALLKRAKRLSRADQKWLASQLK